LVLHPPFLRSLRRSISLKIWLRLCRAVYLCVPLREAGA
jgi:hypothetical protein